MGGKNLLPWLASGLACILMSISIEDQGGGMAVKNERHNTAGGEKDTPVTFTLDEALGSLSLDYLGLSMDIAGTEGLSPSEDLYSTSGSFALKAAGVHRPGAGHLH